MSTVSGRSDFAIAPSVSTGRGAGRKIRGATLPLW
jgi:hypothetical protein